MEKNKIARITKKFLSGCFSSPTEEKAQKWIVQDRYIEEKEKASLDFWNELDLKTDPSTYSALERVNKRIGYSKQSVMLSFHQKITRIVAVIIPLFVLAGSYLYYVSTKNNIIEISVAYGEKRHILLPDSSEIWLNSGTILKYPKGFAGDQRLVELDGEAYFSVKKNATKPFIVKTSQLSVKVLGTKFNVKAYSTDKRITTTLSSGKVEINAQSQSSRILKPNEQLDYDKNTSNIRISERPYGDTDSWITGKLIITNASFIEILQTLQRRYNIVFDNTTNISESKRYTISFLRNENLDETLSVLKDIIGFCYQKRENRIILTNNP